MHYITPRWRVWALLIVSMVFVGYVAYLARPVITHEQFFGVTFSTKQVEALHLPPHSVLNAILTDLGVRKLRLVAYWDDLEQERGIFTFQQLDWQLDAAAAHKAEVILTVGIKVPRWPECFVPPWFHSLPSDEQDEATERLLVALIERYGNRPEVKMWQLENEPFVGWFGFCPSMDRSQLERKLAVLRTHSNKPVLITDSGELSFWGQAATFADRFGTTIYRTTWNQYLGYWTYPLPALFYRAKARLRGLEPSQVIIAELQAEPWPPGVSLVDATITEQLRSMDVARLDKQINFARKTGFGDTYVWGVEWWYWMREQGHPEFWERGKTLFNSVP